jgi:hypothetical protein
MVKLSEQEREGKIAKIYECPTSTHFRVRFGHCLSLRWNAGGISSQKNVLWRSSGLNVSVISNF